MTHTLYSHPQESTEHNAAAISAMLVLMATWLSSLEEPHLWRTDFKCSRVHTNDAMVWFSIFDGTACGHVLKLRRVFEATSPVK
eukprot:16234-Eustigmatos_ZCMA.PRE.1